VAAAHTTQKGRGSAASGRVRRVRVAISRMVGRCPRVGIPHQRVEVPGESLHAGHQGVGVPAAHALMVPPPAVHTCRGLASPTRVAPEQELVTDRVQAPGGGDSVDVHEVAVRRHSDTRGERHRDRRQGGTAEGVGRVARRGTFDGDRGAVDRGDLNSLQHDAVTGPVRRGAHVGKMRRAVPLSGELNEAAVQAVSMLGDAVLPVGAGLGAAGLEVGAGLGVGVGVGD